MKPLEDFNKALCDLSETLALEGIAWAVAGAVAANNYRDQIRTTTDIDVILSLTDKKVDVVLDALHRQGWNTINVVEDWLFRAQHPVNGRLDVLVSQTEYEHTALARAPTVSLDANHNSVLCLCTIVRIRTVGLFLKTYVFLRSGLYLQD